MAPADVLIVYAEAFDRDAEPEDFSLTAIIAHERGHQLLARHPRIARRLSGRSIRSEEILASLVGAQLCSSDQDQDALFWKAVMDLIQYGEEQQAAFRRVTELRTLLRAIL